MIYVRYNFPNCLQVEAFAHECEPDPGLVQLTAVATVAVVTLVNCWSVKLATQVL